jgi:hypothetical protein
MSIPIQIGQIYVRKIIIFIRLIYASLAYTGDMINSYNILDGNLEGNQSF